MFDVGFWELCLVGLVSLLVIGPERLPKAARVTGFWLGKARRMVESVKSEISEELHADEMRQIIREQAELPELKQANDDLNNIMNSMQKPVENISAESVQSSQDKAEHEHK